MKIIGLEAENIKRLKTVSIRPDGGVIQISGPNGAGKSSLLDAIWWALAGATHIQAEPIRRGANKARIVVDLGEFVVTRTFNRKDDQAYTTAIKVENAEGARFSSPQAILDQLVGALSFDPFAFTRMKPAEQVSALRGLARGVDFEALDAAQARDYVARTDLNRRAKEAAARAAALPTAVDGEPIDEVPLLEQLASAAKQNVLSEQHKAAKKQLAVEIEGCDRDIRLSQELIAELERKIEAAKTRIAEIQDYKIEKATELKALDEQVFESIDTDAVRAELDAAKAHNAAISGGAERKRLEKEALQAEVAAAKITKTMDDRKAAMAAAIAAAGLPVDGLTIEDGEVRLGGTPFAQTSSAERIRASVAIAMAMNPKLRVIFIRDASLLDEESMRIIGEIAEREQYQVWAEVVGKRSGPHTVLIEDGEVATVAEAAE